MGVQVCVFFYNFLFLKVIFETNLYCGLEAPKRDLMYFFTSVAMSQRPVPGVYSTALRAMRAAESWAFARDSALLEFCNSVMMLLRAAGWSSTSFGA